MLSGIYQDIKREIEVIHIKIVATKTENIDKYPLDCYSLSHINAGVISYYIGFWIFEHFTFHLSAIFLTYVCIMLGSIFWELLENTILIEMKRNKRVDTVINSQTDTFLVFFGSVIGCYTYCLDWIFCIILIGVLIVLYGTARLFTEKNSGKENND